MTPLSLRGRALACARRRVCSPLSPSRPYLAATVISRRYATESTSPASSATQQQHKGPNIAILGGGVTGLASAHYLLKELPNAHVTIYEASERLGGWLESTRVPVRDGDVLFEGGPRTFRPKDAGILTIRLAEELDLTRDLIFTMGNAPAAQNRFVYYPEKLVLMPSPSAGLAANLWSLMTEPVFKGVISGIVGENFRPSRDASLKDESIGEFITRRLGKRVADQLVSAVVHGIYAGDIYQLSAKSLFSRLWLEEGMEGSVLRGMLKSAAEGIPMSERNADFWTKMADSSKDGENMKVVGRAAAKSSVFTFRDGSQMLADRLAERVMGSGRVSFRMGSPVKAIKLAGNKSSVQVITHEGESESHTHIVSTLSPNTLSKLHAAGEDTPSKTPLIPHIPSVTTMVVNLYYRTPGLHPPGFGYLIPRATPFEQNPERALGVVFDTGYAPACAYSSNDILNVHETTHNGIDITTAHGFRWLGAGADSPPLQDHVSQRGTKLTVMLGGHWWDDWPSYPDQEEGLEFAKSVLRRQLNITEEPEAWRVSLQKDCIPQYVVGHEEKLTSAHKNILDHYRGRLRVTGNWMMGVGVNDCIRSAWEVATGWNARPHGTGLDHAGEKPTMRVKVVAKKTQMQRM